MKTLLTSVALLPLLIACESATHSNARAMRSECSMTLRASSATQLQRAVNSVLEGELDACSGAVTNLRSRQVALARIDETIEADNQRLFTLVFSISADEMGAYLK
jgi:hypothetical protein